MTDLTGRVAAVNTLPLGGTLAADTPAGSTVLVVEDAADFDGAGGELLLGATEVIAYSAADDEAGTLTLATPTAAAWEVDTRVEVWDSATGARVTETVAQVLVDGTDQWGDALEAVVDHALIPYLPEGIRDPDPESGTIGEAVALTWRGDELVVLNIIGRQPIMDGSMIDPETLPPSGGATPEEPTTPGAPVVYGGIASLLVRWDAITHPNPVVYEVHASATPGFSPGPSTLISEISGTAATIRRLPVPDPETGTPDSALRYDTAYYVAVLARDSVDETFASALGPEGSGQPVQATADDIAARSIATEHLTAGAVNTEALASELVLASTIKTATGGQRVEFDVEGIRLHGPDDDIRVNLPTAPGADPTVRGVIQADGLTVREGATFYSAINEFARGSQISLAEQVAGPVAGPVPEIRWNGTALTPSARTGSLGTFALDPSQVTSIGYDAGGDRIIVNQAVAGGSRIWYYNFSGSVSTFADQGSVHVSGSARSAAGNLMFIAKWYDGTRTKWLVYDARYSGYRDYVFYGNNEIAMSWDGTYIVTAETLSDGSTRLRQLDASTNPVTVVNTWTTSGVTASSSAPVFVYHGNADFGATKWVVSYANGFDFRTFGQSGTAAPYEVTNNWPSPTAKAGGIYRTSTGRFYTMGTGGTLYEHTALRWTDSALDTWHVGQSFYDSNSSGTGTHETALGAITSFTMKKRAQVRFSLTDVPFSGEVDDPNAWRFYAKRGAPPATNRSDMRWQAGASYTVKTYTMTDAPTTLGSPALEFGTFPGASPAKMRSARTFASDPTKAIFEVRGDGSGRWGPLEISSAGDLTDGRDTGWIDLPLASGVSVAAGLTPQYKRVGKTVYLFGRITYNGTASTNGGVIGTLPLGFRPDKDPFDLGAFVVTGTSVARLFVTADGSVTSGTSPVANNQRILGGSFSVP